MKKFFCSLFFVTLCIVSFAQNDKALCTTKTSSVQFNISIPKFDIEEDIRRMNLLTNALEKDGLTDRQKTYKLEIKNSEFYINDLKQSKEITDKYRMHFRADKNDNYTVILNPDR